MWRTFLASIGAHRPGREGAGKAALVGRRGGMDGQYSAAAVGLCWSTAMSRTAPRKDKQTRVF